MKQVKSIFKHIGQETNIAYFSLRNTNHPILDRKDGKEIFQQILRFGQNMQRK